MLALDLLFQYVEQMNRVGGDFHMVEVEDGDKILKAKRVESPFMPSSTPASAGYS